MAQHFTLAITDTSLTRVRNPDSIAKEPELDGVNTIRTKATAGAMDAAEAVRVYKSLANVEKIFKTLKSRDLHIRPIYHHTEERTRSHVFLCMLAGHLRAALTPLTFTDEDRPVPEEPVAAVTRCADAASKASTQTLADGTPARDYQGLLRHLATRTRNTMAMTLIHDHAAHHRK